MSELVEQLVRRLEKLKTERSTQDSLWQECAEFALPMKATFTTQPDKGQKVATDQYNSIAKEATNISASGLYSYMTNPASLWFNIRPGYGNSIIEHPEAEEVGRHCSDIMFNILSDSNFYYEIFQSYLEYIALGADCFYSEDRYSDFRFFAKPIQTIYITETAGKELNSIYEVFTWTVEQIYTEFPKTCGEFVRKKYEEAKEYDLDLEVIHVVTPRAIKDGSKRDNINMPFASYWIETKNKVLLEESGYEEMPYQYSRGMRRPGHKYSFSLAMIALADLQTLNSMDKTILVGGQKAVDPALVVGDQEFAKGPKNVPGFINIRKNIPANVQKQAIETIPTGDPRIGLELLDRKETRIRSIMLVDMFLAMMSKVKQMTATEVVQLTQEKQFILAPFVNSQNSDKFDPFITRLFNMCLRRGLFGQLPEWFTSYKIVYVSPLALAAKLSETRSMNDYFAFMGSLAQLQMIGAPCMDNINFDEASRINARIQNIAPKILNDMEQVENLRAIKAQQIEAQNNMAMLQQGADIYSKGAQAEKNLTAKTA